MDKEVYYIYCEKGNNSKKTCDLLSILGYKVVNVIDGYNGLLVDLNCEDYDTIVSKMIEFNTVLKDNLKDFVYEAEINKWIDILK